MTCDMTIEHWMPDEEERKTYWGWYYKLPEHVQKLVDICPPYIPCWTMEEGDHYSIVSFAEKPNSTECAITVAHGKDSRHPGVAVFGITPEDLKPCGCGNWEPPTDDQITSKRAELERRFGMSLGAVVSPDTDREMAEADDNGTIH